MRNISFSHLTALEVGPPNLIDFVADAGFRSTGIRLQAAMEGGTAYPLALDSEAIRVTQERLDARNVKVLDIEVMVITEHTNVSTFLPSLEVGARIGASRICVNGEDSNLERFTEKFAQLCKLAQPFGMEVDLEFMVWRPIKTIQIAAQIVRDSGYSNGKVLIDALHLARSGGQISDVLALERHLIGSVQICDAPLIGPNVQDTGAILAEARAGRLPPLEGELSLVELIQAVPVTTPISVEVPMARPNRFPDLLSQVHHIREAGERCLQLTR